MLERRMMLHASRKVFWLWWCTSRHIPLIPAVLVVIIVVPTALLCIILRSFMFVCAAVILEAADGLVDVAGGVLVELLVVAKDYDCDVDLTQDGKLVRLLEKTAFALEEGDGSAQDVSSE